MYNNLGPDQDSMIYGAYSLYLSLYELLYFIYIIILVFFVIKWFLVVFEIVI